MPLFRPTRSTSSSHPLGLPSLAIVLLLSLAPATVRAQQGQRDGVILGTVLTEVGGEPVDRASISLAGARTGVRTDARGRFVVNASPGSYTLRIRALGFEYAQRPVTVASGDTTTITIVLTAVPQRLGAVTTTAKPKQRESFDDVPEVGTFTLRGNT